MTTPTPDALAKLRELEAKAKLCLPINVTEDPGDPEVGVEPCCGLSGIAMLCKESGFVSSESRHLCNYIAAVLNAAPALLAVAEAAKKWHHLETRAYHENGALVTADERIAAKREVGSALAQLAAGGGK